tara:strand:+ start:240 stop:356 length:117 start_codon:yes stop_codon:yes gene_type:complete
MLLFSPYFCVTGANPKRSKTAMVSGFRDFEKVRLSGLT